MCGWPPLPFGCTKRACCLQNEFKTNKQFNATHQIQVCTNQMLTCDSARTHHRLAAWLLWKLVDFQDDGGELLPCVDMLRSSDVCPGQACPRLPGPANKYAAASCHFIIACTFLFASCIFALLMHALLKFELRSFRVKLTKIIKAAHNLCLNQIWLICMMSESEFKIIKIQFTRSGSI